MPKTKQILTLHIGLMASLLGYALVLPRHFTALLERPELYRQAKFVHILTVTLFFANTVIGTLWEVRGLLSRRPEIIRHTYRTVTWLDAAFTAPLILLAVLSGIMLGTILGGVWTMGWLAAAFLLFLFSGVVWLGLDLPSQHRINRLFGTVPEGAAGLPPELTRLLWRRLIINLMGSTPLLVVFYLMVHKPDVPWLMGLILSVWGT